MPAEPALIGLPGRSVNPAPGDDKADRGQDRWSSSYLGRLDIN